MSRRPRLRWTLELDADLRRYYAWGYSDTAMARILGCSRAAVTRRRLKFGLGPSRGRPGGKVGQRHKPETRAKIAEGLRRRYREDPSFIAKVAPVLARSRQKASEARWRNGWRVPTDPELRKRFVYLRNIIGAKAARQALREGV